MCLSHQNIYFILKGNYQNLCCFFNKFKCKEKVLLLLLQTLFSYSSFNVFFMDL